MSFANCKRCQKPFAVTDSQYCEPCSKIENEQFKKVREYLYEYPGYNVNQVSKATGVPVEKIFEYLRNGRIGLNSM